MMFLVEIPRKRKRVRNFPRPDISMFSSTKINLFFFCLGQLDLLLFDLKRKYMMLFKLKPDDGLLAVTFIDKTSTERNLFFYSYLKSMNHETADYKGLADFVYVTAPKPPASICLDITDPDDEIRPDEQVKVTFDVLYLLVKEGFARIFPNKTLWTLGFQDFSLLQRYMASVDWKIVFQDSYGRSPFSSEETLFYLSFETYTTHMPLDSSAMFIKPNQ